MTPFEELAHLPKDEEGPTFKEPWEAQAFAIVVKLFEGGHFTWKEWADTLAEEIRAAQEEGDPDLGDTYYRHWLAALERIVAAKGLATAGALASRKEAWAEAVDRTPFGEPITLRNEKKCP